MGLSKMGKWQLSLSDEEIDRLLHMVVVGGGPTGIELRHVIIIHHFCDRSPLLPGSLSTRARS